MRRKSYFRKWNWVPFGGDTYTLRVRRGTETTDARISFVWLCFRCSSVHSCRPLNAYYAYVCVRAACNAFSTTNFIFFASFCRHRAPPSQSKYLNKPKWAKKSKIGKESKRNASSISIYERRTAMDYKFYTSHAHCHRCGDDGLKKKSEFCWLLTTVYSPLCVSVLHCPLPNCKCISQSQELISVENLNNWIGIRYSNPFYVQFKFPFRTRLFVSTVSDLASKSVAHS